MFDSSLRAVDLLRELRRNFEDDCCIDQKFLYLDDRSTECWSALCQTGAYDLHRLSVGLLRKKFESDLAGHIPTPVNFIGLGVGNGVKESTVLTFLFRKAAKQDRIGLGVVRFGQDVISSGARS